MFDRIRARREHRASQRVMDELLKFAYQEPPVPNYPEADRASSPLAPAVPVVEDFLPPDLRLPTREEIAGMMMRWDTPLVIGGEIRECPQCGAYRNWVLLSVRDQVWLRCRAGHETLEPALDTAWYNRASGPMDRWHPTLEDGLKHLGH
ncbi:hypothetical protein OG607_41725 [Streptomyces sp. NBC_01537]|uniref:hypothetical protein n=1 Tax=Streptomyces sp. NBC_01537 TaxID=2903896 RepID=UPI0038688A2C